MGNYEHDVVQEWLYEKIDDLLEDLAEFYLDRKYTTAIINYLLSEMDDIDDIEKTEWTSRYEFLTNDERTIVWSRNGNEITETERE